MRQLFFQLYPLVWTVGFWFFLQFSMGTATPLTVVLSESMEPQIRKGDLLIAVAPTHIRENDIVIFELPHREEKIPIVHRVIKQIDDTHYLTKGDNNIVDDRFLYGPSFKYLPQEHIIAKVRGQIPWLGWPSLIFQAFKPLCIGLLVLYSVYKGLATPEEPSAGPQTTKQWMKYLLWPNT